MKFCQGSGVSPYSYRFSTAEGSFTCAGQEAHGSDTRFSSPSEGLDVQFDFPVELGRKCLQLTGERLNHPANFLPGQWLTGQRYGHVGDFST